MKRCDSKMKEKSISFLYKKENNVCISKIPDEINCLKNDSMVGCCGEKVQLNNAQTSSLSSTQRTFQLISNKDIFINILPLQNKQIQQSFDPFPFLQMTTKGISPWSEIFKRTSLKANFCPDCGTILDLPGVSPTILCNLCGYSISTKGICEIFSIWFAENKIRVIFQRSSSSKESKGRSKKIWWWQWRRKTFYGKIFQDGVWFVKIQEKCIECDNDTVYFYTQQTRSVDEGSTVFYECTKCGYVSILLFFSNSVY